MRNFRELKVWHDALELANQVFVDIATEIPKDEKYGLTAQIKRCAVSIPSNIAEGASRKSKH